MNEIMGWALLAGMAVVIACGSPPGPRRPPRRRRSGPARPVGQPGPRPGASGARIARGTARSRREAEEAFPRPQERGPVGQPPRSGRDHQLTQLGGLQAEQLEAFARELNRFSLGLDERFERPQPPSRGVWLRCRRKTAKLEEMRRCVDEKLHATLEQRLGEVVPSWSATASSRFSRPWRDADPGRRRRRLEARPDQRPDPRHLGEVRLAALLEQILTADQCSVTSPPGRQRRAGRDFAIRLPGRDDGVPVWLPIDAKFPVEDHQRLLRSPGQGDQAAVEENGGPSKPLKNEARSIREKHGTAHTTDFAHFSTRPSKASTPKPHAAPAWPNSCSATGGSAWPGRPPWQPC